MESVTFALPQIPTAGMSAQDQRDILLNQSVSIIVTSFIDHLNKLSLVITPGSQSTANVSVMSQAELVSLINDVQAALKSI